MFGSAGTDIVCLAGFLAAQFLGDRHAGAGASIQIT
jgi:hypothetical protein